MFSKRVSTSDNNVFDYEGHEVTALQTSTNVFTRKLESFESLWAGGFWANLQVQVVFVVVYSQLLQTATNKTKQF